jgi:hypothetical protein
MKLKQYNQTIQNMIFLVFSFSLRFFVVCNFVVDEESSLLPTCGMVIQTMTDLRR